MAWNKHDLEFVKSIYKKYRCELLEDGYKDNVTKMKFLCKCGDVAEKRLKDFKKYPHCKSCGFQESSKKLRLSFESVNKEFEKNGCKLLSTEFNNSREKLKYICECGDESFISFYKFKEGQRCRKCSFEKTKNTQKLDYEFVKDYFEENGCQLLEGKYSNYLSKMKFKCSCGKVSYITFSKFYHSKQHRCYSCYVESSRGEGNPNWRSDKTTEERLIERKYFEYENWRKNVFERDAYKCQCCGHSGGNLNAHHLDGYNWCIDKRTDVNNGATLCELCHSTFHKFYGNGNNTAQQFEEFINYKYSHYSN